MEYRRDVEGLRAVAVLPVVLFHSGLPVFSGGYVGVDVFFVISGYLITTILTEPPSGSLSLRSFFERRARRLVPALLAVLLVTTLACLLVLNPRDFLFHSQAVAAAATFTSNFLFFFTRGYFSAPSATVPLLHTWSLGVEAQFYLLFPLLVRVLRNSSRPVMVGVFAVLLALSLGLSIYLTHGAFAANFYLFPPRAWEFLAGAMVALAPLPQRLRGRVFAELSSLAGLALVLCAVVVFDNRTPFPGLMALVPVGGAALVIASGTADRTWVARLLSTRLLVGVGLISYSLYLWHQPVFALMRLTSIGRPPPWAMLAALPPLLLLSWLTWRHVELPFRRRGTGSSPRRATGWRYALACGALALAGGAGVATSGAAQRFAPNPLAQTALSSPYRAKCHTGGSAYLKPAAACTYFGGTTSWASFGDSHTVELAYALAERLRGQQEGLLHLSFSGCPPALLFPARRPGCNRWIRESLEYLESQPAIRNVVVGFRHSAYLFGDQLDFYPAVPTESPRVIFGRKVPPGSDEDLREIYWRSFAEIVRRLMAAGKVVHVLYPYPELPLDIVRAVYPRTVLDASPAIDLLHATPAAYYRERHAFILRKLDSLPYGSQLRAVRPLDILCTGDCPATLDQDSLYFDDNHLSVKGAARIASHIAIEPEKGASR